MRQAEHVLEPGAADFLDYRSGGAAGIQACVLVPRRREPIGAERSGKAAADHPAVEASARTTEKAARCIVRQLFDNDDRVHTSVRQRA